MSVRRRSLMTGAGFALSALAFSSKSWGNTVSSQYWRLMQGPMISQVTQNSISIWMRAANSVAIQIDYGLDPTLIDAKTTAPLLANAANDFTVIAKLEALQPATTYYYRVRLAGRADRYLENQPPFAVATNPILGAPSIHKIAFGSCARVQAHRNQPIWDAVSNWRPDLFLWLGDNVYHDTVEPRIMDEMWRWQRMVPNLERLQRSVPQLAIWDDHDYGLNNSDSRNVAKDSARASFMKHWDNPPHNVAGDPAIYFKTSIGAVDIFMLDGRWHRCDPSLPDGPTKTKLGAAQLSWLKQELSNSRATFKLIAAGGGWTKAKGPAGDAWSAFVQERDGIFNFIRDNNVKGVVLLSGDTHVGELNAVPWSDNGGYDLYEIVSSPLAQDSRTSWLERRPELRMREVFVGTQNFGTIDVNTNLADPTISFNLVDIRGNQVWAPFTLKASDLQNGKKTWPQKISALSADRLRQTREGLDYYAPDLRRD